MKRVRNIVIDGIEVNLELICSIEHECLPEMCQKHQCCCSKYEIHIDKHEIGSIVGCLPDAVRFAPHLHDGRGFINVFEEGDGDTFIVETGEDELCLFAYVNSGGHVLCSLHSTALSLNIEPKVVKPLSCLTWPLALSEGSSPILSIAEDCMDFSCNRQKRDGMMSLDERIECIVKDVFGMEFLNKVQDELNVKNL